MSALSSSSTVADSSAALFTSGDYGRREDLHSLRHTRVPRPRAGPGPGAQQGSGLLGLRSVDLRDAGWLQSVRRCARSVFAINDVYARFVWTRWRHVGVQHPIAEYVCVCTTICALAYLTVTLVPLDRLS